MDGAGFEDGQPDAARGSRRVVGDEVIVDRPQGELGQMPGAGHSVWNYDWPDPQ